MTGSPLGDLHFAGQLADPVLAPLADAVVTTLITVADLASVLSPVGDLLTPLVGENPDAMLGALLGVSADGQDASVGGHADVGAALTSPVADLLDVVHDATGLLDHLPV